MFRQHCHAILCTRVHGAALQNNSQPVVVSAIFRSSLNFARLHGYMPSRRLWRLDKPLVLYTLDGIEFSSRSHTTCDGPCLVSL